MSRLQLIPSSPLGACESPLPCCRLARLAVHTDWLPKLATQSGINPGCAELYMTGSINVAKLVGKASKELSQGCDRGRFHNVSKVSHAPRR